MSNQYLLSRREAITLFGISAASIAAATTQPNPSAAHASTGELDTIAGSARAQYIFGYGSLVQRESRIGSWASAEFASPVIVKGVARGWFDQTGGVSWNPTYLGGGAGQECDMQRSDLSGQLGGVRHLQRTRSRLPADED
jgi:hypothetical protein